MRLVKVTVLALTCFLCSGVASPAIAQTPAPADRIEAVRQLTERDYVALEKLLGNYTKEFESNPRDSTAYGMLFDALGRVDASMTPSFDQWISRFPNSYSAHVARGAHLFILGIKARGTEFRDKTTDEQFKNQEAIHLRAAGDFVQAIKLSEKPFLAYDYIIRVATFLSDRQAARAAFDQAFKLAPTDVRLRLHYLELLKPRWGGSYESMQQFVDEAKKANLPAPSVARLAAQIPRDRAQMSWAQKNLNDAIREFGEAIDVHPDPSWICERAELYWQTEKVDLAAAELKRGMALDARDGICNRLSGYMARSRNDHPLAIEGFSRAIDVNPTTMLFSFRGTSYEILKQYEKAFPDYLIAAKDGQPYAQTRLVFFYWNSWGVKRDLEQAVYWARQATASGHIDAKKFVDRLKSASEGGDSAATEFLKRIERTTP